MNALELKVPPPVVLLVLGLAMWGLARITPGVAVDRALSTSVAIALALIGGAIAFAASARFRRAKTTANPMKPQTASTLVTSGIYRFTRNPMYVGLLLVLTGWAVYLRSPWALAGPLAFVAYITRFQIQPEERALLSVFGDAYADYLSQVRRWL